VDSLIYVRIKSNEIFFMQMSDEGMEFLEYLIHAYLSWEQCRPIDE